MKLRNTLFSLLCAMAITASAIPARRGVVHQFQQPDGTMVSLELVGDEHNHYYVTTDKQIVLADGNRYIYATVDSNGDLKYTNVLAHDPDKRSADESDLVSTLKPDAVRRGIYNRQSQIARSNNQDGNGRLTTNFPCLGNVKSIVLLVAYSDVPFETENAKDYFNNMLNQPGFSENDAVGSCFDYFRDASFGKFLPEFDVYGPVTLPQPRAYYGANSTTGNDKNAKEMLLHAGQLLDAEVDFSQYDLDGDGYVDNVFIFYAGASESDGAGADCVWPHQSYVGFNTKYKFDGVQLNRYACGSELSDGKPDGIGTFCHEFTHVLGIPDLYNTKDSDATYTPNSYDLMDNGCYNGGGHRPPTFSAFERNALGWMGDNLVEITGASSCTLEHIETSNMAYLINTDDPNEYFILENRQQTGWDTGLKGHGMLIWHIDYNKKAFNNNTPNNDKSHQRIDIVEAGNKTGYSSLILREYPFPGYTKNTSFTFDTKPSFQTWSGIDLGLPITNIKETKVDGIGVITFDVAGGGADPAGIADVTVGVKMEATVSERTINAKADGAITITDLSGRVIATGDRQVSVDVNAPGIYIVASPLSVTKLLVH